MPYKDPELARQKTAERLRRLRAQPGYAAGKNKAWQDKHPEKRAAHKAVEYALKRGGLVKATCEVCAAERVEAHHIDYSKPLEVRWLCRSHHIEAHRKPAI